ncbi:MAG: hypothetical protein Q4E53_04555 [Eubacteriales bacterium]|nr:hypothetical protein [Eubacteriales bacterium]
MRNILMIEASLKENPFFSKSIETLGCDENGEEMFGEVFEITTCSQLREYEELNDFAIAITSFMMDAIDPFDLLVVTAASDENILRWSLEIKLEGDQISLRTIDWKNGQCVYKHEDK